MKYFYIDSEIADAADKELHSIKIPWQYLPYTSRFYQETKYPEYRPIINSIGNRYGPIQDSQKFTWTIYNEGRDSTKRFAEIRYDQQSVYNTQFPATAKLIDAIQQSSNLTSYRIIRIYVNMQTIRPAWYMSPPHADFLYKDVMSVLYYANDSDGDTYFFDGDQCSHQVTPQRGKGVVYSSNTIHAGSTPVRTQTRVVVNIILCPKDMQIVL